MRRALVITASVLAFALPVSAQWGGGAAQAGANAYCGARAAGKSHKQASRAATNALVNGMGGNFSSNIATIVTGGGAMRDSMAYLIQQQCPDLYFNDEAQIKVPDKPKEQADWEKYCLDNPWLKECGGQNPGKVACPGCEDPIPAKGEVKVEQAPRQATPAEIKASKQKWDKRMAEQFCMKAADFAGCMKYKMSQ